jgi:hypothetical protein
VSSGELRGFHECWEDLADVEPNILDLYRVRDLGGRKEELANKLIAQGKVNLADIPDVTFARGKAREGELARRQRIQIACSKQNAEWISGQLGDILNSLTFPLHFVDFETCAPAIPHYRGMRPYETIAYQWSCQTLQGPDAEPDSSEWLQQADAFPNSAFADTLRGRLGTSGSILVWASHEATVLRTIRNQLVERSEGETELSNWLNDVLEGGRIVDMHQLTLKHYCHPRMGGSTSIKAVANAVWQANSSVRARLPQYQAEAEGIPASPYRALQSFEIGGRVVSADSGTGAILAYYKMMEHLAVNSLPEVSRLRHLLLEYCRLDTLAMVMVWWHWRQLVGQATK